MTLSHNRRTVLLGSASVAVTLTGVGAYFWNDRTNGEPGPETGTVQVVAGPDTKTGFTTPAPIAESVTAIETPDPEVETNLNRMLQDDVANSYRRSLERRQGMAGTQTPTPSDMPTVALESAPPAWAP